jgi:hypothetical protein
MSAMRLLLSEREGAFTESETLICDIGDQERIVT